MQPEQRLVSFPEENFFKLIHGGEHGVWQVVYVAYELRGKLDLDALAASFRTVVARHENLRASFRVDGEGRLQKTIRPEVQPRFSVVEASPATLAELYRLAAKELRTLFDLENDVLVRGTVFRAGETSLLIFVFSHLVFDFSSRRLFLADLAAIYSALISGKQPSLAPVITRGDALAQWQREVAASERSATLRDYWVKAFARTRPLSPSLGGDHPADVPADSPMQMVPVDVPSDVWRRLAKACRALPPLLRGNGPRLAVPTSLKSAALPRTSLATAARSRPPRICSPRSRAGATTRQCSCSSDGSIPTSSCSRPA